MLIGLHGKSRSGKDSVAGVLVRKYGFTQVALATAIRELLLKLNPMLEDDNGNLHSMQGLWHDNLKDWDMIKAESRESVELMIRLGQGARDIIGEDVWLSAAFPGMMYFHSDGNVVVSDVRQPNEVEFIRRKGGELWYIERPELTESRGMDGLLKGVQFDEIILNNGTLADLEETVSQTFERPGDRQKG